MSNANKVDVTYTFRDASEIMLEALNEVTSSLRALERAFQDQARKLGELELEMRNTMSADELKRVMHHQAHGEHFITLLDRYQELGYPRSMARRRAWREKTRHAFEGVPDSEVLCPACGTGLVIDASARSWSCPRHREAVISEVLWHKLGTPGRRLAYLSLLGDMLDTGDSWSSARMRAHQRALTVVDLADDEHDKALPRPADAKRELVVDWQSPKGGVTQSLVLPEWTKDYSLQVSGMGPTFQRLRIRKRREDPGDLDPGESRWVLDFADGGLPEQTTITLRLSPLALWRSSAGTIPVSDLDNHHLTNILNLQERNLLGSMSGGAKGWTELVTEQPKLPFLVREALGRDLPLPEGIFRAYVTRHGAVQDQTSTTTTTTENDMPDYYDKDGNRIDADGNIISEKKGAVNKLTEGFVTGAKQGGAMIAQDAAQSAAKKIANKFGINVEDLGPDSELMKDLLNIVTAGAVMTAAQSAPDSFPYARFVEAAADHAYTGRVSYASYKHGSALKELMGELAGEMMQFAQAGAMLLGETLPEEASGLGAVAEEAKKEKVATKKKS